MPNEAKGTDWVVVMASIIASAGTCLAGLGILINLYLQPVMNEINALKDDVQENKEMFKTLNELTATLAGIKSDYKHTSENMRDIKQSISELKNDIKDLRKTK